MEEYKTVATRDSQGLQPALDITDKPLTKNQKHKRRKKLGRLYCQPSHQIQEIVPPCAEVPAEQITLPKVQQTNPKLVDSVAVDTAEPSEHLAQQSHGSISPLPQPPSDQPRQNKRPRLPDVHEEDNASDVSGESEDAGCAAECAVGEEVLETKQAVCREDMSHAAVLLTAVHQVIDTSTQPAPLQLQSQWRQPEGRTLQLAAPSESAGSADIGVTRNDHAVFVTIPGVGAAVGLSTQQAGGSRGTTTTGPLTAFGRNGRRIYLYGNYHKYYGYRLQQAVSEDPRLRVFERCWFAGKRCMDIGCNEGLVTLSLATRFGTRSMVGVDIDEKLVKKACMHLREERSAATVRSAESRKGGCNAAERRAARMSLASLAQTWFVHADFLNARTDEGSVDCLTALSVTKWVHLHRGDAGLRAFFARVRALLAQGGLFVLEPQPWTSYKTAAAKLRKQAGGAEVSLPSSTYFHRPEELDLRPEGFPDMLCREFGFVLLRRLQPPEESSSGFDRHMYVFKKV